MGIQRKYWERLKSSLNLARGQLTTPKVYGQDLLTFKIRIDTGALLERIEGN